jgi:hypothetical protein
MGVRKKRNLRWAFLGFFALAFILYFLFIFPWMLNWGANGSEILGTLPGDEVVRNPMYRATRALTIAAPVEDVWSWIAQLGQDRGGFYSYTWIENMMLADIHNVRTINPDWLTRREGELLPLTSPNYPLGLVQRPEKSLGPHVRRFEPNAVMVLEGWGSFVLQPLDGGRTRFIVRDPTPPMSLPVKVLWQIFFEPGHFAMEREMMKGIRSRAEGNLGSGSWAQSLATTGFILTVFIGGFYVALTRRKWPWLIIPLLYTVTILITTGDAQASLVGLASVTLIIAGCLYFRRWWWAFLLTMFIYVNAGLLLPWDAYTAFGIIFLAAFLFVVLRLLSKKELISSIKSREEARRKSRG